MTLIFLFVYLVQNTLGEPAATHQIEFDSTVVEGASHNLSGVTTVRTKQSNNQIYSLEVDFAKKVHESIQDSANLIIPSKNSSLSGSQP